MVNTTADWREDTTVVTTTVDWRTHGGGHYGGKHYGGLAEDTTGGNHYGGLAEDTTVVNTTSDWRRTLRW